MDEVPVSSMPVIGAVLTHRRLDILCFSTQSETQLCEVAYHKDPIFEGNTSDGQRLEELRNIRVVWVLVLFNGLRLVLLTR